MHIKREDMLLTLLLDEMMKYTGHIFEKENGENINLETIQDILKNENIKDNFYELIVTNLTEEIEKYIKSIFCEENRKEKNSKIIKLYK